VPEWAYALLVGKVPSTPFITSEGVFVDGLLARVERSAKRGAEPARHPATPVMELL